MKTIAKNANDFADLRTADGGNCVYVDKTDYFLRLITAPGEKLFFIARPRRFGKSLMITTFKYIFAGLRSLFAHLPYGSREGRVHEMSYERALKILFWAQGLEVVTDDAQSAARADIVVKYRKAIYVFELKRDGTAAEALAQIREKGYEKPYLADGRPVYLIGLAFDELPIDCEVLRCPRERTILCTWEPVSIKSYSKAYTRQFGYLLTNRPSEAEGHPHYHLGRGYFLWFVHDVPKPGAAVDKPNVISAVCSSKQMKHTRHHDRFELVKALASGVDGFDWYGKGVKPLERKEDALVPYKYHIAIENHIAPHHWTEKFSDAILCECLPFYAGDPAITEIFPAECFIPIPIDDPAEAVRIVKAAIAAGEYERRREAILEAKRLILTKYNFWHQVIEVVEEALSSEAVGRPLPPPW